MLNLIANSLYQDQARQNVGPDLDPNSLTMIDIFEHLSTFSFENFCCVLLIRSISSKTW